MTAGKKPAPIKVTSADVFLGVEDVFVTAKREDDAQLDAEYDAQNGEPEYSEDAGEP